MQIRCPFCKATIESKNDGTAWCAKCRVEFHVADIDGESVVFKPTFDITRYGEVEGWDIYTAEGKFMGHVDGFLEMAIKAVRSGEVEWLIEWPSSEDTDAISIPHPYCPFTRSHGLMEQTAWEPEQDGSTYILWRCKECGATVEMTMRPGRLDGEENAGDSPVRVADEQ